MSFTLDAINLAGAVVGTTGSVDLRKLITSSLPPNAGPAADRATLRLQNESGCGLQINMVGSSDSFIVAAGQWLDITLMTGESAYSYRVLYVLPNAPVTQLLATYFAPGESVPAMGVLGNSPIGLAGSVPTSVTQVINDVNPSVQAVLEATPTTGVNAGISSAQINNDGAGYLGGNKLKFDNAGDITLDNGTANSPAYFLKDSVHNDQIESVLIGEVWNLLASYHGGAFAAVLQLALSTSMLYIPGGIANIGGQASVGSFGAPVIVAQALAQSVSVTTVVNVLSFSPPTSGLYRVHLTVLVNGTNNGQNVAKVSYTDPITSTALSVFFCGSQNNQAPAVVNGMAITKANTFQAFPIVVYASSSAAIIVQYQNNAAGTITDTLSAFIERIS